VSDTSKAKKMKTEKIENFSDEEKKRLLEKYDKEFKKIDLRDSFSCGQLPPEVKKGGYIKKVKITNKSEIKK